MTVSLLMLRIRADISSVPTYPVFLTNRALRFFTVERYARSIEQSFISVLTGPRFEGYENSESRGFDLERPRG
jgi:hypothetical protein